MAAWSEMQAGSEAGLLPPQRNNTLCFIKCWIGFDFVVRFVQMRAQRLAKQPSPQRSRSPADSLAAWKEMQAGSELGQRFCLRFKLEPMSENGALRDPVAWRGIDEPHYKTGACMRHSLSCLGNLYLSGAICTANILGQLCRVCSSQYNVVIVGHIGGAAVLSEVQAGASA
jgi:hypothetical protein